MSILKWAFGSRILPRNDWSIGGRGSLYFSIKTISRAFLDWINGESGRVGNPISGRHANLGFKIVPWG
jgi:hypothetical protein